ncbi:class I SAM-dependent methyltransferase [Actinoplanes sp. TFC3]|uniref:class I SAM-dependent methyltransferase n=1 Tax=Actinoplanes sp. TFC3 TaxID=1710355 RepID=UPI0008347D5D|nr:methyltransferase domain-containing protein [Actinoplanes sp. TFC3]
MSDDAWSEIAELWSELWGQLPAPIWRVVLDAGGISRGAKVLDVGCGAGDFVAYARSVGLDAFGVDPAPGMVEVADRKLTAEPEGLRSKLDISAAFVRGPKAFEGMPETSATGPGALAAQPGFSAGAIRLAEAEHLLWPDDTFHLVTAFNSVQFAGDTDAALFEMIRVTLPGGHVAVANWAERDLNEVDSVERALDDEPPGPDGDLRVAGGLEELFGDCGLTVVASGLVEMPWEVPDEAALVRGILLGEEPALAPEVTAAALPYRNESGGYRFVNHFRFAVGRKSAGS